MEAAISQHWNLAWMLAALLLIAYLGSPRLGGRMAFRRVKRLLEQSLDKRRYTQFHDILLPVGGGTERADHVLVSRFGVMVVVSERRPGQISGGESQEAWKQVHFGRTRRWPNPLYRAKLHMEALQRLLDMPRKCFHIVVAVDGQSKPLKNVPEQVTPVGQLMPFIRSKNDQVLTPEQADRAVKIINENVLGQRRGWSTTGLVRAGLGLAVLIGAYVVYWDDVQALAPVLDERIEQWAHPERFDEQGMRKSEQQIFEESLTCAFSQDTMRCSCYRKGGEKVDIEFEKCRELAERGSILKQ